MSRVPPPTIGDKNLLRRIVEADFGEGDADACARLSEAIGDDARAQQRADEIYRMWDLLGTLPAPRGRKALPVTTAAAFAQRSPRSLFTPLVARAVAASLVFAMLALGVVSLLHSPEPRSPGSFVVATQKAERRVAQLPDGSTVELSGESAIKVQYSETRRDIRLIRGQALFEVAHNKKRPFIVKAGEGEIRAVGTAFDVDLNRRGVIVTVTEGVVRVSAPAVGKSQPQSAVVEVGEQLFYSEQPGEGMGAVISSPRPVDVASALSWKQGLLEFHGEPLSQVIEEVNRHAVGRVVLLDPSEADTPIYGVLRAGDLEGLASILRDRETSQSRMASPVRIEKPIN